MDTESMTNHSGTDGDNEGEYVFDPNPMSWTLEHYKLLSMGIGLGVLLIIAIWGCRRYYKHRQKNKEQQAASSGGTEESASGGENLPKSLFHEGLLDHLKINASMRVQQNGLHSKKSMPSSSFKENESHERQMLLLGKKKNCQGGSSSRYDYEML